MLPWSHHDNRDPIAQAALSDQIPEEVAKTIDRMSLAPGSLTRFSALCALSLRLPRDFVIGVVIRALNDRSAEVRWKAVDRADAMSLRELIHVIEARRAVERSQKVRRVIDFQLPLLKHGHFLERRDNHLQLVVKGPAGISSGSVTQEQIDRLGLEQIAEHRRSERLSKPTRLRYVV